ncbi:MAG: hypothetical protein ACI814_001904, partial [Mariniblastus sp.]
RLRAGFPSHLIDATGNESLASDSQRQHPLSE